MYATEYDLIVAEDRIRDRLNEMEAIRLAQASHHDEVADHAGLIDRLMAATARITHLPVRHGHERAAA